MNFEIHCYQLFFGAEGKIVQIGQTEAKSLAFANPKAYKGTPRGEVCSKRKAIKFQNSSNDEFPP